MSNLAETRTAIAHVNTGKNANEDSWMTWVIIDKLPVCFVILTSHCSVIECGATPIGEICSSQRRCLSLYLVQLWSFLQARMTSVRIILVCSSVEHAFTLYTALISTDDVVPYKWQYAKVPGSFKACLMQMVILLLICHPQGSHPSRLMRATMRSGLRTSP